MSYYVRLMHKEDIPQVTVIERAAFPTQWPSISYEHELRNPLARYSVVCDDNKLMREPEIKTTPGGNSSGLVSRVRRLFSRRSLSPKDSPPRQEHYIIGFVGFWVMADEAHITSIAVREAYRRQGIGELLLIAAIDSAAKLKARVVTLEVRVSNTIAQNLYTKYGFSRVGVRRAYYSDNREDALVMTTQDITLAPFQAKLHQLKQIHAKKQGIALNP